MEFNKIYNEDCLKTMDEHIDEHSVDIIMTSPPYPTSVSWGKTNSNLSNCKSKLYPHYKYDMFMENRSPEEYIEWTCELFNRFSKILKPNGVCLYNLSYSSVHAEVLPLTISSIITDTEFNFMDMVCWKKPNAINDYQTPNKLTRIFELIYVFGLKGSEKTHMCNKPFVRKVANKNGNVYQFKYNYIEAKNNDGTCKLNRATYSSEMCEKVLDLYAPISQKDLVVYDPFMGSGTTAVACKRLGLKYIGSEISENQVEYARKRIEDDDGIPKYVIR